MSETVILSKTSSRQCSQPREPPTTTSVVGETGRLDKMSGKSKSGALVVVKELVQRDSSRLVKDLMALLAIREATKEGTIERHAGAAEVELLKEEKLHKNRPGNDTVVTIPPTIVHDDIGGVGGAGTKTTAAVASLLHHTARKEFSSLAGEMIAIADDSNEESSLTNRTSVVKGTGTKTVHDDDGNGAMMMMLHADAAAAESNTREHSTNDGLERRVIPTATAAVTLPIGEQNERKTDDDATAVTTATAALESKLGRCFLSEPVPVRSATPVPSVPMPFPERHPTVVLTLEQKLDKLLDSVVKIKTDMHRRIDRLGRRVEQIHLDVQLNIDNTDRALLRNDLLLIGIPYREREDLQHCFRDVCRALEYADHDIPAVDIRRQRLSHSASGGGGNRRGKSTITGHAGSVTEPLPPAPIVVEFMFKTLRDQFYRAYQAKRVLRLSDIGIASDRRFFVNEVLTKYNQKLMAEAVRRKRLGLLHSVYTVDGIVYVQRMAGEKGTKVTNFSSMN